MASVLELLSWRKFWFIHAFVSSRHEVRMADVDGAGWSVGEVEGGGFILMWSWVSSA